MAYFKNSGTTSRGTDKLRNLDVELTKPEQVEQRIANTVIQDKLEVKTSPLGRLTSYKTSVTYYKIKTTNRNDFITNTQNIGSVDVNKNNYQKIKDMIIICQDALNTSLEKDEGKVSLMGEGSAKVLPNTIQPMVGEHFVMMTLNKKNLYRVTSVNKTSIETDSSYEFTYSLVEEESEEKLYEIEKLVTENWQFVYAHVGTAFRVLFREDEYESLRKLNDMYLILGELYNEFFFNEDKNTYTLKYDSAVIKDESGAALIDSKLASRPYTVLPSDAKTYNLPQVPKLNSSDTWYGSTMYDKLLTEFIIKTGLFSKVNKKVYRPTQLQSDYERSYGKSIYYALEYQTNKRFSYKYHLPSPVTRLNIATNLNLYGVVILEPFEALHQACIQMWPKNFLNYVFWQGVEGRDPKDPSLNVYTNTVELICEIIGMWINKKDINGLITRLDCLYDKIDEFASLSYRDQNQFYLFPMLAFIIRKVMDIISEKNEAARYAELGK